ncbi:MAG: CvpA family protein, partial [Alphaproteobacteria bacterium]
MPISWLDIILASIMLISGFLAMLRGLTREVLSILSWAVTGNGNRQLGSTHNEHALSVKYFSQLS